MDKKATKKIEREAQEFNEMGLELFSLKRIIEEGSFEFNDSGSTDKCRRVYRKTLETLLERVAELKEKRFK